MTHIDFSREKETPNDTAMQIICTVNHKKTNSLKKISANKLQKLLHEKYINSLENTPCTAMDWLNTSRKRYISSYFSNGV